VKAYHFALLRQVLENISSFLGVGQFGYVLKQIGIGDVEEVAVILNTLSHKKVYYYESDDLKPDNLDMFNKVFLGLKDKYQFVLHTPTKEAVDSAPAKEPMKATNATTKKTVKKAAKKSAKKAARKAPKP
jgi:hypothetical protein